MHRLYGYADHVKDLMDTSKRNRKQVSKKDIITSEHVQSLFAMYSDSNDPIVIRDIAMIITCYCVFFIDMMTCQIFIVMMWYSNTILLNFICAKAKRTNTDKGMRFC